MTERTPATLSQAVRKALRAEQSAPQDVAARRLALTYAEEMDADFDKIEKLGPKLLAVLESLGLTPKGRSIIAGKGVTPRGNRAPTKADQLRNEIAERRAKRAAGQHSS
jgi:hypothetical protein